MSLLFRFVVCAIASTGMLIVSGNASAQCGSGSVSNARSIVSHAPTAQAFPFVAPAWTSYISCSQPSGTYPVAQLSYPAQGYVQPVFSQPVYGYSTGTVISFPQSTGVINQGVIRQTTASAFPVQTSPCANGQCHLNR